MINNNSGPFSLGITRRFRLLQAGEEAAESRMPHQTEPSANNALGGLLGFDEETYAGVRRLAAKWCAEPSVHGGKSRPRGSVLVM